MSNDQAPNTFEAFFRKASGNSPYPYQRRLAEGDDFPSLLSIPTGLGKTAAVILAWFWRRRFAAETVNRSTPRRLVYCLPMRVLVEQTHDCAVTWLKNLGLLGGGFDSDGEYDPWLGGDNPGKVRVHLLMGGDVDRDWDQYPERDAILVGTQDMLLSRALNRGYAMSRYRWPMQFALLNNDCLWVMDEVQLMGSGLATTAQIQAFRRLLGTAAAVRSLWMSATMKPEWLSTVDFSHEQDAQGRLAELDDDDRSLRSLQDRFEAKKPLSRAECDAGDVRAIAKLVCESHKPGTLTLAVVNTVRRAQDIFLALERLRPSADLVLMHSRFRPADRQQQLARFLAAPGAGGTIAISTQVVEAGVDVSATTLITDLAPWSSLVQRFGRCNREGTDNQDALVLWLPLLDSSEEERTKRLSPKEILIAKEKRARPYSVESVEAAEKRLVDLSDVGPVHLPAVEETLMSIHVIRRKDLIDLFDTTPDLAGADLDVSRFIREADDHDVQVFFRDLTDKESPSNSQLGPTRDELCSIPIADAKKKVKDVWRWDALEKRWASPEAIFPGLVLLLRASDGGYSSRLGWTGNKKDLPDVLPTRGEPERAYDDDHLTTRSWQTLVAHTDSVVDELERLLVAISDHVHSFKSELRLAARWHDAGKAHPVFQLGVLGDPPAADPATIWAKSALAETHYPRRGFRHELASALAMLLLGQPDLAAYLAAAHHGKVRLSIRSMPHEKKPDGGLHLRFARGVWDEDEFGPADLGAGATLPHIRLDLSCMELGEGPRGPSWLERTLCLRDDASLGPFRLAYLEMLLRVSDWRGSANVPVTEDRS